MSEHIEIEIRGAVQIVRMNRPEKKNAITRAMYAAMAKALNDGDADDAVRCHVILGVPGAFSAGNDLADFLAVATGGEHGTEVLDFLLALARVEKPVVSGVDGLAVGIGATIQFHCDLTFATPQSLFKTPFVDLGISPEAGSSLLAPALMGRQNAFALLAMSEAFPAERAKECGMVYEIVEASALEARVMAAAKAIAAKPATAMRVARDLMLGDRAILCGRIEEEVRQFSALLKTDDARKAFEAFMNRKK